MGLNFFEIAGDEGLASLNEKVVRLCRENRFDLVFWCSLKHEFFPHVFDTIRSLGIPIAGLSFDDAFRCHDYAKTWLPLVDFFIFNDPNFTDFYKSLKNESHFFPFPSASLEEFSKIPDCEKRYDLSFVGTHSPYRAEFVSYLRENGLKVFTFGKGWDGKDVGVEHEEMVRIFNQTRINLNLEQRPELVVQLKGRIFEVGMTGNFLLSHRPDRISEFYEDGKDLATFSTKEEMLVQARHFLEDSRLREECAARFQKTTLERFSAEAQIREMFRLFGISGEKRPVIKDRGIEGRIPELEKPYFQGCFEQILHHLKGRLIRGHWNIFRSDFHALLRLLKKRPPFISCLDLISFGCGWLRKIILDKIHPPKPA